MLSAEAREGRRERGGREVGGDWGKLASMVKRGLGPVAGHAAGERAVAAAENGGGASVFGGSAAINEGSAAVYGGVGAVKDGLERSLVRTRSSRLRVLIWRSRA